MLKKARDNVVAQHFTSVHLRPFSMPVGLVMNRYNFDYRIVFVLFCALLPLQIGCRAKKVEQRHELLQFLLDYHMLSSQEKGKVTWASFEGLRDKYPRLAKQIDDGEIVVVWNVKLESDEDRRVLVYPKDAEKTGGLIGLYNAEVQEVSAAEFATIIALSAVDARRSADVQSSGSFFLKNNDEAPDGLVYRYFDAGLRIPVPQSLKWSNDLWLFLDRDLELAVQAIVEECDFDQSTASAMGFFIGRDALEVEQFDLEGSKLRGRLYSAVIREQTYCELLVMSDDSHSLQVTATVPADSRYRSELRRVLSGTQWKPNYQPDFTMSPEALENIKAIAKSNGTDLEKSYLRIKLPEREISLTDAVTLRDQLIHVGPLRIIMDWATAWEADRVGIDWATTSSGAEGFAFTQEE